MHKLHDPFSSRHSSDPNHSSPPLLSPLMIAMRWFLAPVGNTVVDLQQYTLALIFTKKSRPKYALPWLKEKRKKEWGWDTKTCTGSAHHLRDTHMHSWATIGFLNSQFFCFHIMTPHTIALIGIDKARRGRPITHGLWDVVAFWSASP